MPSMHYINTYVKHLLKEFKTDPGYQKLRDNVGLDNLTLSFARNVAARRLNFESWEDLLQADPERKRFVKIILSHPYIWGYGVYDRYTKYESPDMDHYTSPYTYEYTSRITETIKETVKPTQSINYKTDQDKLYHIVAPEALKKYPPCGNIDVGQFILAMLLAGFKMVKRDDKLYFNVSEKSLKAILQTKQIYRELFGGEGKYWACYDHMYPEGYSRVRNMNQPWA